MIYENSPCHPKNGYERTKLEAEKIITNSKTPFVILRPTNVFGDHHPRKALMGFFQRIKEGKFFPIKKDAVVNYVYAKDVAHAICFSLQNNIANKTVNIGEAITLNSFIEMTAQELSIECKIQKLPGIFFSSMETFNYFGIKKLKTQFRGVSNKVSYSDKVMQEHLTYKYGLRIGIKNSLSYYST